MNSIIAELKTLESEFAGEVKALGTKIAEFTAEKIEAAAEKQKVLEELQKLDLTGVPISPEEGAQEIPVPQGQTWNPLTFLGLVVNTAGFDYHPEPPSKNDFIYSTMYNYQRLLGYCQFYDDTSFLISSRIDSEVILFDYKEFQWMIELWKGQYGIETGCEIGVYRRRQDQPVTELEKVTGPLYACVPDNARLLMASELKDNNNKMILARQAQMHWWLTGFHWGMCEDPGNLEMKASITLSDKEMKNEFTAALNKLGYTDIEMDGNKVSFMFGTPKSTQPASQEKFGTLVMKINSYLVRYYNLLKAELNINTNDPNIIGRALKEAIMKKILSSEDLKGIEKDFSLFNLFKDYLKARFLNPPGSFFRNI